MFSGCFMVKMLIIQGEQESAQAWRHVFTSQRFMVDVVADSGRAYEQLFQSQYDVIIMDAELPLFDVIEHCRQYRNAGGNSPILLTSAEESSEAVEKALDAGVDDYMSKPIKLRELSARVRALLRRPTVISGALLVAKDVELNSRDGTVTLSGEPVHLHPMELNLLEFFMRHPNQVFSAELLLERVWPDRTESNTESVRTHIKTLRQKVRSADHSSIIVTVHGRGYKLVP